MSSVYHAKLTGRYFRIGNSIFLACIVAFKCLWIVGCSPAPEDLVTLEGRFLWEDGSTPKNLQGTIILHPYDSEVTEHSQTLENQSVTSLISSDGRFQLATYRIHDGNTVMHLGVPKGKYKVRVFLQPDSNGNARIHPDYEHPIRTPLALAVESGGFHEFVLDRTMEGKSSD